MTDQGNFVLCYNKGCGTKFDPSSNDESACQFHPGNPIFHDARKKWSCCNKGSTDFSVFLSFPGCSRGPHNPDKPVQVEAPKEKPLQETEVIRGPCPTPKAPSERPSADEALILLKPNVAASLPSALATRRKQLEEASQKDGDVISNDVKPGTSCSNNGCKGRFESQETNKEVCYHHPGVPIFHEGDKFWSCCQRKTCDFEQFLAQVGCHEGKHKWSSSAPPVAPCRVDWHQTGSFVTISVFAKCIVPESCVVQINRVRCEVQCSYDAGQVPFQRSFLLHGTIDPEKSNVKLMGTKMEVNLRKAEPECWAKLEIPAPST